MTARDDYPGLAMMDYGDTKRALDEIDNLRAGIFVRPGDTLIVNVGFDHSAKECFMFKEQIMARLPGVDALVVTAQQLLVYRPEGT